MLCGQTQSGTTLKFLLERNIFVTWCEREASEWVSLWVRERSGGCRGADLIKHRLLSPPQQLSHHLPVLHYATFPCSFLSDIKGWCEFYWTQNHMWTFSHLVQAKTVSKAQCENVHWGRGRWCVTPKCFTTNTRKAIRLLAAGLFWPTLLLYNVQVLRRGKRWQAGRWGEGPLVSQTRSTCSPWWRNGNCQLWT